MDDKAVQIENLFEKAEEYVKTNVDLFKYKAIGKSAEIASSAVSNLTFIVVIILIAMILNIGLSLWIGEILGKSYFGFFIVGGFYAVITVILYVFRQKFIKSPVNDLLITKLLIQKPNS